MNLVLGVLVGILLTIGTAFIADAYTAPEVTCSKQIVNWDVKSAFTKLLRRLPQAGIA